MSVTKEPRQTSDSLNFMSRIVSRLPVILLTILLGVAFQYGAAVGSVSAANQSVHLDHPADSADDNLLFAFDTIAILDRNGSDVDDSHTDHSCLTGICASCVPVIVSDFIQATNYIFVQFSQYKEIQFLDSVSSTLFRPPKA